MKRSVHLWAVVFWLAVWQLTSMALNRSSLLVVLASPVQVLRRTAELAVTAPFWASVGFTLARIAVGFFLAAALGVLLAALSLRFRRVEELLAPAMLTIRTVPVASFIILALILFSSRNLSLLISFLMVLPIIYTNVLAGLRAADPQLSEMARVFRLSRPRAARYLYLPQVFPYFRAACVTALGLAWKSGVAAEVIGMPRGSIGDRLQEAKLFLDIPDLFSWTLVIVLASLAFEKAVLLLLDRGAKRLERI